MKYDTWKPVEPSTDSSLYPTAQIQIGFLPRYLLDYRLDIVDSSNLSQDDATFAREIERYKQRLFETAFKLRSISLYKDHGVDSLDPASLQGEYERSMMHFATHMAVKRTISTWNKRARQASISLAMSCSRIEIPEPLEGTFSDLSCCPDNGTDELALTYYSTNYKMMRTGASTEDKNFLEASKEPWERIIARIKSGQTITESEEAEVRNLVGGSENE
ncbi:uncharacterized protein L199_001645 [Kwoniella botswanensis]|uniref:uncharacterized protein n=1 Tax=Kwoniella botswanensis TaxID=1268659 RepID=UPI00315DA62D